MSKLLALLPVSALALLSLPLGGCSALGLGRVVPDEFAVVQHAPLSTPPDLALRPPQPGAPPSQEVSPTDQTPQTISRAADPQPQAAVPDADKAPPDVRETVNREAAQAPKGGSTAASGAVATTPPSAGSAAAAATPSVAPAVPGLLSPPTIERRRDPSTG